ncbi:MAG: DUF1592 domain-containing protein [Bacteroidota bacterium]
MINQYSPIKIGLIFGFTLLLVGVGVCEEDDQVVYAENIKPLIEQHCYKCHGNERTRAGINLEKYKTTKDIYREGHIWLRAFDQVKSGEMPPDTEKPLTEKQYKALVEGIDFLLNNSLKERNPGRTVSRRLSNLEYHYSVKDIFGVDFNAREYFPADASGGEGFDNQARTLFVSPLKLERYYEASNLIVEQLFNDQTLWRKVVPTDFEVTVWQHISEWFKSVFYPDYVSRDFAAEAAVKVITPVASRAYRRYLSPSETDALLGLFTKVYHQLEEGDNAEKFNTSIAQVLKAILVSPGFLYRIERDHDYEEKTPYQVSNFDLASRLSFFLWCSVPDEELLELARYERLQDSTVLVDQVLRMLNDPKSARFSEAFSSQWFGIGKLINNEPIADPEKFPDLTTVLRRAMYDETVNYFSHILNESKDFLELINGNYTFLNETLADHYGIEGVTGESMQFVRLDEGVRGGILGMGSFLTVSSLPERTSPVLRGKWVLERILGTPPPPPPPDVPDLEGDQKAQEDIGLRRLLEIHREKPECRSCHEKMDPIGLGLENFDAIGRWRDSYGIAKIDPAGVMATGETFSGPADLKKILAREKEKFARNLSIKMLSFAIGRGINFSDEPTVRALQNCLLENDFNTDKFLITLVTSYTFREKVNDRPVTKELI